MVKGKWKMLTILVRSNLLTILTILSVIIGAVLGIVIRNSFGNFTEREVYYVNFIGDLFLQMLKSLILPLIVFSLISAVGSLDLSLSRKIGGYAIVYYIITTIMAVILGIILVMTIQPGYIGESEDPTEKNNTTEKRNMTTVDTFLDLIRNMFPPNLVQACLKQYQTVLVPPKNNYNPDLTTWKISSVYAGGMNILGLVVASCVFGVAMSSAKAHTQAVQVVINELTFIMMKITGWVIWLSPVGIFFLIFAKILEIDDLANLFEKLGVYFLTVLCGILFHGFVILPLIFFAFTRKNPYSYLSKMGQVMATAFGTASSSATLPLTIRCLEEQLHIDSRVTRFVLPIGATINMDGTALYEAVAAIFIAQIRRIPLSFGDIVAISLTATAASIGAAGIPQAGLVTMVMVLETVGLPAEDVSLILAVDWLLDRFRTMINVVGDTFGAAIVAYLSREELKAAATNDEHLNGNVTDTNKHIIGCDRGAMGDQIH